MKVHITEMMVTQNQVLFVGQVKDILTLFADYPPSTTLLEYINMKLN
jgi:hypothetical protein